MDTHTLGSSLHFQQRSRLGDGCHCPRSKGSWTAHLSHPGQISGVCRKSALSAAEESGLLLTYFVLPQEEKFKTYSLNHRRRLRIDKHQSYGPKHLPGMCAVSSWEGLPGSLTWGWIFGEQRKKQLDWLFKAWTEVFLQRPAAVQRLVSQANLHKFTVKEEGKRKVFPH